MLSTVLIAVGIITGIALVAGLLLSFADRQLPASSESLVETINDLLPQTQCAQCGYPGCKPYAKAIIENDAAINLCPPGGQETVDKLASVLGRENLKLLEQNSIPMSQSVAVIEEKLCIGCTHCRNACPVDAIVGAHQMMHTIITSECTGCELCVAPCPVDCISMVSPA
jgi:electron transport complex protein RnfB